MGGELGSVSYLNISSSHVVLVLSLFPVWTLEMLDMQTVHSSPKQ